MLRSGPYGLTEEGAKALLVARSIGDAVASAAFALGAPISAPLFFCRWDSCGPAMGLPPRC